MNILEKLLVAGFGALVGSEIAKGKSLIGDEKKQKSIEGALLGASAGLISCELFGENDDTVNYSLYHKSKKVYDGIVYEDRLNKRLSEHKCNEKIFDKVVFDDAKPRSPALEIERKRIKRNRGPYNIHYNS